MSNNMIRVEVLFTGAGFTVEQVDDGRSPDSDSPLPRLLITHWTHPATDIRIEVTRDDVDVIHTLLCNQFGERLMLNLSGSSVGVQYTYTPHNRRASIEVVGIDDEFYWSHVLPPHHP